MKIEKGIPIPSKGKRVSPFRFMEIGDSTFLPRRKGDSNETIQTRAVSRINRIKDKKFVTRLVEGGVRIWRIE